MKIFFSIISASFLINYSALCAASETPFVLILTINHEAICSLSEKVIYGESKPIPAIGGQIGHIHNGKEYGPRGCLLSIKNAEWENKFKYCRLTGFGQPEFSKSNHKKNEQGGEFSCRFTRTPDGFYVFESFGRRGAFCEFACE